MTEHIMVLHRWRDRYALYEDYIDHAANRVTYITTALGRASVPERAAMVAEVPATDDFAMVGRAAGALAGRFGTPARVVALNEGDLDTAARLRDQLGCPGQLPGGLARFRDKLTMTYAVARAGIRTPIFADAPNSAAVARFAEEYGWPVVVKPRRGTASRGVMRFDELSAISAMDWAEPEPRLVETFCPDPIYHIDGLWTGTELGPWRASRYLNTCVGFNDGDALGSVEVDDPVLLPHLGRFAAAVAGALSDEPWVFHLEAFVGAEPDGAPRITFLEVGYRVGGAEIPFVWREVHGVDLMAAAVDVQLGRGPGLDGTNGSAGARAANVAGGEVGGWLLVPTPVPAPCRVTAAHLADAPDAGAYASVVPPIGYVVPKAGGYEHVGARFRFRGARTADVESAIVKTAAHFRLECVPEPAGRD